MADLTHFPRKMRTLLRFLRISLKLNGEVSIFWLKSFVKGFKLKEIVFYSLVFTRYNYISRLCTFFDEVSIYQRVFFITFDTLELGN